MRNKNYSYYGKGDKRRLGIEMQYRVWYIRVKTPKGIVTNVVYSGNSVYVYGNVYVEIDSKDWYIVNKPRESYRPRKDDIHRGLIPCNKPLNAD